MVTRDQMGPGGNFAEAPCFPSLCPERQLTGVMMGNEALPGQ